MNKYKYILVSVLVIFLIKPLQAQTNEEQARQNYLEAKAAYEKQDYKKAVQLLLATKQLLGKTNMRVQPLLIRALAKAPAWQYVNNEVKTYQSLNPDTALVEYDEIMEIARQADYYVNKETDTYKALERNPTIAACKDYLSTYPFGIYHDDVNWLIAKTTHTMESYFEYMDNFPKGKYFAEAKSIIDYSDKTAYDKAIKDGTQEALKYYLDYYPRGPYTYRKDVQERLTQRIEYDVYTKAINGDLESYIAKYPHGKYSNEINRKIEEKYFALGNSSFDAKDYENAQVYYNKYISKFPQGSQILEVKQKLDKCIRISNRRDAAMLTFSYDTEKAVSLSLTVLNLNKISPFFQVRIVPEHLDAEADVDSKGKTSLSNVILTNEERNTVFSMSFGMTYKIAYPVWILAGGYVGFYHVQVKDSKNTWYNNTDKATTAFSPHLGISYRLGNRMSVQYMQIYHKGIVHQIGFGVDFGR